MSMVSGVVGGVDTHADVHVAAALDENGRLLGIESFRDQLPVMQLRGGDRSSPVALAIKRRWVNVEPVGTALGARFS
jgi:hypothetical protein